MKRQKLKFSRNKTKKNEVFDKNIEAIRRMGDFSEDMENKVEIEKEEPNNDAEN